jgi:hypothetical protein
MFTKNEFRPADIPNFAATFLKTVPLKVKSAKNEAEVTAAVKAAIYTPVQNRNVKDNFNCFDYTNWAFEQLLAQKYITQAGFDTLHTYYEAEKAKVRQVTNPIIAGFCQRAEQKASGSGRK